MLINCIEDIIKCISEMLKIGLGVYFGLSLYDAMYERYVDEEETNE